MKRHNLQLMHPKNNNLGANLRAITTKMREKRKYTAQDH